MRLGDEKPSALIHAERDGIAQQWLGGDEFDLQSGRDLELLQLRFRGGVGAVLRGA